MYVLARMRAASVSPYLDCPRGEAKPLPLHLAGACTLRDGKCNVVSLPENLSGPFGAKYKGHSKKKLREAPEYFWPFWVKYKGNRVQNPERSAGRHLGASLS